MARLELAATVARISIPCAAAVAIAWLVTGSVGKLAGQYTYADIGVRFVSDFKLTISYVLTGAAAAWALLERKLKGDTIKRLSARNQELEKRIDPDRTSSGLSERGTTRPGDD